MKLFSSKGLTYRTMCGTLLTMNNAQQPNGENKMTKVCNECLEVFDKSVDCPECGSTDWDMENDPYRFNGGLDDDC